MINRVILVGRLTKDPELRYTPKGIAVCTFTLAVDRPFNNTGGERETDFIPIVVWRQLAETTANYLRKGRLTGVEGRIQVRNYENNEGHRVYVTEVVADNVRFLESANAGSGNRSGDGVSNGANGSSNRSSGGSPRGAYGNSDPFTDESKPIDISDDDLPF